MMRRRMLASIAVCVFCLVPLSAIAANSVGKVVALTGDATATGEDGKARKLTLKSDVFLNDKILTAAGSKIQIMLNDDSVVSQGELSDMTIDKYVYDPDGKKDVNCSVKLAQGVFRVVTGKITDMNPERFKVRTKMATIGIRGCELGFALRWDKEDVYVLELPKGKSILIKKLILDELIESNIENRERVLTITQVGMMVSIQPGQALKEREITPEESKQLMKGMMPAATSRSATDGKGGEDQGGRSELMVMRDRVNEIAGIQAQTISKDNLVAGSETQPLSQGDSGPEIPSVPVLPPPTEPPSTSTPVTEPPAYVAGSPMGDWEWGLWNDGTVQYSGNRYNGASFLTASDFRAIADGASTYNLSGSGEAGAVLYEAATDSRKTITGMCSLQVQVGGGPTAPATWGGSFAIGDQTDGLNFSLSPGSGTITDGALGMGTLSSYSMTINGNSYPQSSLTASSLSGNLIKPASGTPPITAAAGEFSFQHGSAARANGVFGSDLLAQ